MINTYVVTSEYEQDFKDIQVILKNMTASSRKPFEISNLEHGILIDIAQGKTKASFAAQSLLFIAKGYEFKVEIPPLPHGSSSSTVFRQTEDIKSQNGIHLYPNPVRERLNVELSDDAEVYGISMFSQTGEELLELNELKGILIEMNTSDLTSGLYFIKVSLVNGDIKTLSFMKQ